MAASDVSTGYREFLLEPGCPVQKLHRVDKEGHQWLPDTPAIWRFKQFGFFHRHMLVWGDAPNRLLCVILTWWGKQLKVGAYKSTRQLPAKLRLDWVRSLEPSDPLPKPFGPDVESYIRRLECQGQET